MSRVLENRLRRLEAQRPSDPFARLSEAELEALCLLTRDALDGGSTGLGLDVSDVTAARMWQAVETFQARSPAAP